MRNNILYFTSSAKESRFIWAKISGLILLLLFGITSSVVAQHPDSSAIKPKKLYVGVELSSITYSMQNFATKVEGRITPVAHINVGYKLSKRANIQVGFAYGRDKENRHAGTYYGYGDTLIYYHSNRSNSGFAIPLTIQYTPFNPARRLNYYATASLIPVFGKVHNQETEAYKDQVKIRYEEHDAGIYTIATAGLFVNYKLNKYLEAYGKINLYYKFIGHDSYFARQAKSIAVGVNYNL